MTETISSTQNSSIMERAGKLQPKKTSQVFRRLMAMTEDLRELREAGYTYEQINKLLAAENIRTSAGTLREYTSRLLKAEKLCQEKFGRNPTMAELAKECGHCKRSGKNTAKPEQTHVRHISDQAAPHRMQTIAVRGRSLIVDEDD